MLTRPRLTTVTLPLLALAIAALPATAQHDGGHMGGGDDEHHQGAHHEGMAEHMHSDEMMEQMSMMMDHMTEMLGEMHGYHEQLDAMWQHQEHMGETHEAHASMMQAMSDGMDHMIPYMETMMNEVHAFMDRPHDASMEKPVESLMKHMETMLQAGRDAMATIHGIAGEHMSEPAASGASAEAE